MDKINLAASVKRDRKAQRLPATVADPAALRQIAALLAAKSKAPSELLGVTAE